MTEWETMDTKLQQGTLQLLLKGEKIIIRTVKNEHAGQRYCAIPATGDVQNLTGSVLRNLIQAGFALT